MSAPSRLPTHSPESARAAGGCTFAQSESGHAAHDRAHRGAHSHGHHDHGHSPQGRANRLLIAFALTLGALVAEAVGGWISGSLALLADAGHMLVDALALLFAWLGARLARRPPDAKRSFGYARLEVLVGYSNALAQFALVAWIATEAIMRLFSPTPILSGVMLAIAVVGLAVNAIVLGTLGGHDHDDLNTASARLHVIGDLLGSIGAIAAALAVRYFDWLWADPLISIAVSLLILGSAWRLVRRSAHILLEGAPEGVDAGLVAAAIEEGNLAVREVHHVHVWVLAGGSAMATLHARLADNADADAAIVGINRVLRERFGIAHATVQLETEVCDDGPCRETTAHR